MSLLEIKGLQTWFYSRAGIAKAVDGVDLKVARGETLALVGESGSGKSVTAYSILKLIPAPAGRIVGGQVLFDGVDLLKLDAVEMQRYRGNRIAMIFQEPMTALNPVFTIGSQIAEAIRLHQPLSRKQAWERAIALLDLVQIPAPRQRANEFPHRLSGGMRQRVVIAMALACEPDLLIADEPTTALDVTTQAQILALIKRIQQQMGMGIILITHDLGVVAEVADRAAIMYAGKVVEEGTVQRIFDDPWHPYTQGLLASLQIEEAQPGQRLPEIAGTVPSLLDMPSGCAFAPRCSQATSSCLQTSPRLLEWPESGPDGRKVACYAAPMIGFDVLEPELKYA